MKWIKTPDKQSIKPIYTQIKDDFLTAIENGQLKVGDNIPSINKLCNEFELAPGTVIHAFEELREMGVLSSKQGKGFFIASTDFDQKTKIFLLFDKMTSFKEILYESFREEFDEETDIQVFFHHYDLKRFEKLIRENLGRFSHYVLMPHLQGNIQKIIARIPEKKIVFIDNLPGDLKTAAKAVYQDFFNDIYNAMGEKTDELRKYNSLNLSLSQSLFQFVPDGIRKGFSAFCETNNLDFEIIKSITEQNLKRNELYIIFDDGELVKTLKMIEKRNWKLKDDIGIISFDDAPMKELLAGGISVLSTDFVLMGKTAAEMVKGNADGQIANPFGLIYRNSF